MEETTTSHALALTSALAAATWLGVIVLLHVLKPELDPRFRMVSEYARPPCGWIMQLAFFSVAASCWSLAAATWARLAPLGPALLVLCGVGFVGAGAFITDPVLPTEKPQTRSGVLHVVFALFVIVLFPITATVVTVGLAGGRACTPLQPWLSALTGLVWIGFISLVGAAIHAAQRPATPIGYFQRSMILTYSAWLIAIGGTLAS